MVVEQGWVGSHVFVCTAVMMEAWTRNEAGVGGMLHLCYSNGSLEVETRLGWEPCFICATVTMEAWRRKRGWGRSHVSSVLQ